MESPFEINDYVRSYLGESKDTKEFAKQFIEKRSYFKNQAKRQESEVCRQTWANRRPAERLLVCQELMWGPAPAITPSANKASQASAVNTASYADPDGGFVQAGKKKKSKGKRLIDNSILGFTVQADPDRINAGEIEQIDDWEDRMATQPNPNEWPFVERKSIFCRKCTVFAKLLIYSLNDI